ncbi:hypothetical protein DFH27DRAFT_190028 [Peziza echinospora]|nr:hypothetical protein DFH27DRAFT_190028 [Peziza echinospora]
MDSTRSITSSTFAAIGGTTTKHNMAVLHSKHHTSNTSSANSNHTQWTPSRCNRILRPFTSKLAALRNFLQSTPSAAAAVVVAGQYLSSGGDGSGNAGGGSGSGSGVKDIIGYGGRRRKAAAGRDIGSGAIGGGYVSNNGSGEERKNVGSHEQLLAQRSAMNPALFTMCLAIYGAFGTVMEATRDSSTPSHEIKKKGKGKGKSEGKMLPPPAVTPVVGRTGAPSLRELAIHSLAKCIIVTAPGEALLPTGGNDVQATPIKGSSMPMMSSDAIEPPEQEDIPPGEWYDAVDSVSPSYLPTLLRWHTIELLSAHIMQPHYPCSLGAAIAGWCFENKMFREGEALLWSLLRRDAKVGITCLREYLVDGVDSARGWRVLMRFLERGTRSGGIVDSTARWLSAKHGRWVRDNIWRDWAVGGRNVVKGVLKGGFGFGLTEEDIDTTVKRRKKRRRRTTRRGAQQVLGRTNAKKVEEVMLEILDGLARCAMGVTVGGAATEAKEIVKSLADGLLSQPREARDAAELMWGKGVATKGSSSPSSTQKNVHFAASAGKTASRGLYPRDAKVLVLLFALVVFNAEEPTGTEDGMVADISMEIARVLDEERFWLVEHADDSSDGPDAFMDGVVDMLIEFYRSDEMGLENGIRGVQDLVKVLIDVAYPSSMVSSRVTATDGPPSTPLPKTASSPNSIPIATRSYYLSRLALSLATRYPPPGRNYTEPWVEWVESIETLFLKMPPLPTPKRKMPSSMMSVRKGRLRSRAAPVPTSAAKGKKEGWRYEEGVGAWVARTGKTPQKSTGAGVLTTPNGKGWTFKGVLLSTRKPGRVWPDEYETFYGNNSATTSEDGEDDDEEDSEEEEGRVEEDKEEEEQEEEEEEEVRDQFKKYKQSITQMFHSPAVDRRRLRSREFASNATPTRLYPQRAVAVRRSYADSSTSSDAEDEQVGSETGDEEEAVEENEEISGDEEDAENEEQLNMEGLEDEYEADGDAEVIPEDEEEEAEAEKRDYRIVIEISKRPHRSPPTPDSTSTTTAKRRRSTRRKSSLLGNLGLDLDSSDQEEEEEEAEEDEEEVRETYISERSTRRRKISSPPQPPPNTTTTVNTRTTRQKRQPTPVPEPDDDDDEDNEESEEESFDDSNDDDYDAKSNLDPGMSSARGSSRRRSRSIASIPAAAPDPKRRRISSGGNSISTTTATTAKRPTRRPSAIFSNTRKSSRRTSSRLAVESVYSSPPGSTSPSPSPAEVSRDVSPSPSPSPSPLLSLSPSPSPPLSPAYINRNNNRRRTRSSLPLVLSTHASKVTKRVGGVAGEVRGRRSLPGGALGLTSSSSSSSSSSSTTKKNPASRVVIARTRRSSGRLVPAPSSGGAGTDLKGSWGTTKAKTETSARTTRSSSGGGKMGVAVPASTSSVPASGASGGGILRSRRSLRSLTATATTTTTTTAAGRRKSGVRVSVGGVHHGERVEVPDECELSEDELA